jgi:hypothetical protein
MEIASSGPVIYEVIMRKFREATINYIVVSCPQKACWWAAHFISPLQI